MEEDHGREQFSEQVRQLYSQETTGIIVSIVNSLILAFVLREQVAQTTVLIWVGVMVAVSLIRLFISYKYRQDKTKLVSDNNWYQVLRAGFILSGIVWGMAGVLLLPDQSLPHQLFIAFMLGGMVAGASALYSIRLDAFFLFALPAVLPVTINFLIKGGEIYFIMAIVCLIFLGAMSFSAFHIFRISNRSLELRFQNMALLKYLIEERDKGKHLNQELERQIAIRKQAQETLRKEQEKE